MNHNIQKLSQWLRYLTRTDNRLEDIPIGYNRFCRDENMQTWFIFSKSDHHLFCFICSKIFLIFFFRYLQVNLTLKYFLQYKEFITKKKQSLLKEGLVYSIIFYSTIQTIIVMASYIDFNNHHNENNTENLYEAIMRRHA